jgi:hypothetical protein
MVLRWWAGEKCWISLSNRLIMLGLGALGGGLLAITGTIGGHLHGAPSFLTDVLRQVGWEVYATFYLPNWVLLVLAVVIIVMPIVSIVSSRSRPAEFRREGGRA